MFYVHLVMVTMQDYTSTCTIYCHIVRHKFTLHTNRSVMHPKWSLSLISLVPMQTIYLSFLVCKCACFPPAECESIGTKLYTKGLFWLPTTISEIVKHHRIGISGEWITCIRPPFRSSYIAGTLVFTNTTCSKGCMTWIPNTSLLGLEGLC